MAGGNGKRLWPLSSKDKPKQLKKYLRHYRLKHKDLIL
ncbi:nucleotidyl transferase family protein [Rickettsia rhipicephali str. Ect]|uniref:Nucleotidyl transferase family protein n=1 Tax=Rickettsia rhipicephali str. Ect TaxID=1359199 RepID=A0A0F3PHZ5_RICRH|nr:MULTISPECIES: sugar phosphate nucleotidyltransferase [spotted fever group]KJV78834.1 nucleotidyl transferase family protein [Rickettsia rhipicephali str. Ect]